MIIVRVSALRAEERYAFDARADGFAFSRRPVLGVRTAASGGLGEPFAARASWTGYDNSVAASS